MINSNIFFPIEVIDRELDAKLLTAALLSCDIESIVFAQHDLTDQLMSKSVNGVYFGKNIMNPKKISLYRSAKERGFVIVHLDEEGGIYQGLKHDIESILSTRLDASTMQHDDHIFTWGKFQEDYYRSMCNDSNQPSITTTGHTRFNLLNKKFRRYYTDKAETYKNNYGPYILVTTTFGFALSPYGFNDTFSIRNGYGVSKYKSSKLISEWSEQMHKVAHIVELIHEISPRFPEFRIIVRPHVAEDKEFYKSALGGLGNVKILNVGTVIPWVIGSNLVIHNGSTVGLEAYFSEKPVIHYEFRPNEDVDSLILKKIGHSCNNPKEVIRVVSSLVKKNRLHNNEEFDNFDYEILTNLIDNNCMKIPKLLGRIINDKVSNGKLKTVSIIRLFIIEYFNQAYRLIKIPIRKIFFPDKHRIYLADTTSFPGFSKSDLLLRIEKIEKLTGKKLKIKFIGRRVFFLSAAPEKIK